MAYQVEYDNTWKHKCFSNYNSYFNDKVCNIKVGYFTVTLYGDSWFSDERLRSLWDGVIPNSQSDLALYGKRPVRLNLVPHISHSYPIRVFNFSRGVLPLHRYKMS